MGLDQEYLMAQAEMATITTTTATFASQPVTKKRFRFAMEMARDLTVPEDAEYLIDGLAPLSGLMAIFGPPGTGKSFVALDVACHVAAGLPYFGKPVRSGLVVYIAAEAGAGMRKRLIGWQNEHGLRDFPVALISAAPNLGKFEEGISNDSGTLIREITEQSEMYGEPPRLVIIDTLARTLPGADENSSTGMGAFIKSAGMISQAFGDCLVVAVHHTGKNSALGMRGHSSLHGACDAEWRIEAGSDGIKVVTLEKLKEGADRLSWEFALKQVDLPKTGPKGEGTTSITTTCVVVQTTSPSIDGNAIGGSIKGNDAVVLEAITALHDQAFETYSDREGEPVAIARSAIQEKAKAAGIGDPQNPKSQNTMINRSISKLVDAGRVEIADGKILLL